MNEFLVTGGPVLWAILACSALATAITLDRWFHVHRAHLRSGADFLKGIFNNLQRGNVVEAVSLCEEAAGPVAQIVRAGILEHKQGPGRVRKVMEEVGLIEITRLEKSLGLLLTLAQTMPLLGLLGTVLGMMQVLQAIHQKAPVVLATDLGGGMWQALLTTAAGLTCAIPAYVAYNFLVFMVEKVVVDMERSVSEMSLFFSQARNPPES
jgi:biopolymer transport protein ExbB